MPFFQLLLTRIEDNGNMDDVIRHWDVGDKPGQVRVDNKLMTEIRDTIKRTGVKK